MIKIVNKKNYKSQTKEVLYDIDRGTALGNPFKMNNENDREKVILQYEEYFNKTIKNENSALHKYVKTIINTAKNNNVTLKCWCAPKKCHGDIIKKYIETQLH